jgi:hypothetical protein
MSPVQLSTMDYDIYRENKVNLPLFLLHCSKSKCLAQPSIRSLRHDESVRRVEIENNVHTTPFLTMEKCLLSIHAFGSQVISR